MEKDAKNTLDWKEIGQRFRELRTQHGYERSEIMEKPKIKVVLYINTRVVYNPPALTTLCFCVMN